MISPELLRRYTFFSLLSPAELKEIAMITEEISFQKGDTLFHEGEQAGSFYLLTKGSIELYFVATEDNPQTGEFLVGEINTGEPFGISTLIEPYHYTSTARAGRDSQVLKVKGEALRNLVANDDHLAFILMQKMAKAFAERLRFTRIQLAAARG